jgi:T5SS/PEP-CTERM-associated repeat protein
MTENYYWIGGTNNVGAAGSWETVDSEGVLQVATIPPGATSDEIVVNGGELVGSGEAQQLNIDASVSIDGTTDVGEGTIIGGRTAGTVTVDGGEWTETGYLTVGLTLAVGNTVDGALVIENDGTVADASAIAVGQFAGGVGILDIFSGSTLTTSGFSSIGGSADGTGIATIDGVGSSWQSSGAIDVGNFGTGDLNVSDDAIVYAANGIVLGETLGAVGTLDLSSGGTLDAGIGGLTVGGYGGGSGTLIVNGSGSVKSFGSYDSIGGGTGSEGSVVLDGSGASWTSQGYLTIGGTGSGTVTVDGGLLTADDGIALGQSVGGSGTATLSNGGTLDAGTGGLNVGGGGGRGTLIVNGSGSVESFGTYDAVGNATGSQGSVVLDGAGASWTSQGNLTIGNDGTGTVTVDGGTLDAGTGGLNVGGYGGGTGTLVVKDSGSVESLGTYDNVGSGTHSHGSVVLDGAGASWTSQGRLTIGNRGTGNLTVSDGATVYAAEGLYVGTGIGGVGTVTIESGGSVDAVNNISVGGTGGTGAVTIDTGGTLALTGTLNPYAYLLQIGGAGSGTVVVSGAGAVLTTDGNPAAVGEYGSGTLLVTDGATTSFGVSVNSLTADSALSVGYAGIGSVIVSGPGSTLTVVGATYLAHSGTASLTVSNYGSFFGGNSVSGIEFGYGNTLGTGGVGIGNISSDGYLHSDDNIFVGQGGDSGTLDISGAAKAEAANSIFIGFTNSLNGTLVGGDGLVTVGAGSTLQADATDITVSGTNALVVGAGPGSVGTLEVSGSGALATTDGNRLAIGNYGTGYVTIADAGTIDSGIQFSADSALFIGQNGGTGFLTITDPESTYNATGQINVGTTGSGTLLVENGGTVNSGGSTIAPNEGFVIASGTSSSGDVTVTGAGSEIINNGRFIVGGSGNSGSPIGGVGTLVIEDGSLVQTSRAGASLSSPGAQIAADPGTGGSSVTVTGTNSTWQIGGPLLVGNVAAGTLAVAAAGTVTASEIDAGVTATGAGEIDLTGADSQIDVSGLVSIGDAGRGSLSIGSGATLAAGTLAVGTADQVSLLGGLLDVLGSITNSGGITAANGTSEIGGMIGGLGSLVIGSGADLLLDSAVGSSQSLSFASSDSTLTLEDGASFAGTIIGLAFGDTIDVVDAASGTFVGDVLHLFDDSADIGTLTFSGPPSGISLEYGVSGTPCYCRGTLIRTDHGEVAVEDLRIGDRLITNSGVARQIVWIGQRRYANRFAAGNPDVLPILIRAGALADATPRRDLLVSPLHAMYLDACLIPAFALVNGTSIVQVETLETIEYFHVELATHDVILAEGAPSETFVDDDSRGMFHNADEYRLLYPQASAPTALYCAPRVEDGEALERVRRRLAARTIRHAA